MALLILGVLLFAGVHLLKPLGAGIRARLAEAVGENGWRLIVVVLLLISIWLMALGYGDASAQPLWTAPLWLRHLTIVLMIPVFMLFFATHPGSWLRAKMRHPQLAGFKLWAALHLLVNGDVRSVVLFGGLLAWAVIALILINKRDGKPPLPAPASNPAMAFLFVPVGLVVWAAVYWAHGAVFGVYPAG